ncbi:hypothetical protein CBR_g39725 [Chara braunii]|uniref:BRO1 domain-containing protein n=1 Tax=Chara braunii TaxID=69332 RepID=A0A388LS38_CHABU|nr:hypothetical protein CBR_g39725 [Chara braunii]|eukprot:GBG85160.1 hypothetical protein CBR_g39725 [Chara braunii]
MLLRYRDLSKLQTKKVVFEESYYAKDSATLELLRELTTKRRAIEEVLNGRTNIPATETAMAGGITSPAMQKLHKCDQYIPFLANLVEHVVPEVESNAQLRQWTLDLKIRWTSVVSGSSGRGLLGPKFFRIDDLRFELCMTMWVYAAFLREQAYDVVDDDLAAASRYLNRAAGVFAFLAEKVLPPWEPALPAVRPPEVTVAAAKWMQTVCLAEAQGAFARRGEVMKMRTSVLAKLHFGVLKLVEEVQEKMSEDSSSYVDISEKLKVRNLRIVNIGVSKCYDEGVCPKGIQLGKVVEDGGKRFVVNEEVEEVKEQWLKERSVIVVFQGDARSLSRAVKEDLIRAFEDGWTTKKFFQPEARRGRVKFEHPNVVSYVAKVKEIAEWLLQQKEMVIKLEGKNYTVNFRPRLSKQELQDVRIQEAESKFWTMALRVPLEAYFYLGSAVEAIFGGFSSMQSPEYDRDRPKLMNVKFEMPPDARTRIEDDLTIQSPKGESWKVDIVTPYTDWCRRCRWYFHTEDNCPKFKLKADGRGGNGERPGGHKLRFRQHLQDQERASQGRAEGTKDQPRSQQHPIGTVRSQGPIGPQQSGHLQQSEAGVACHSRTQLPPPGEGYTKMYLPILDARIPPETASLLEQSGVRWIHMDLVRERDMQELEAIKVLPVWRTNGDPSQEQAPREAALAGTRSPSQRQAVRSTQQTSSICWLNCLLPASNPKRPHPPMMNKLRIATWNVRGLGDTNGRIKRRRLRSWVHERKIGCAMLQESKLNEVQLREFAGWWDGPQIWSPAQGTRGGMGILIHRDLQAQVINAEADLWGRWAWMKIVLGGEEWVLVTTYAPTNWRERAKFFTRLKTIVPRTDRMIIAGDWNVSLDEALRPGAECAGRGDVQAMLDFSAELTLTDPFPVLDPDDPGYTWFSNLYRDRQAITRRRLDFFLLSEQSMEKITAVRPVCHPMSDHKPVVADISLSADAERGKGFFRLNSQILEVPGIGEWVSDHMARWEETRPLFDSTAEWLDGGIAITSGVLDVCSRILARTRNKREAECKRRIEEAEDRMEGHPISTMVWAAERERRMTEWNSLQEEKEKRWVEILRVKGVETHDKMTKEMFLKLQPQRTQQQMVELPHPFNSSAPSACSSSGMLQYARLYYSDILTSRRPQDSKDTDLSRTSDMWEDTTVRLHAGGRLDLDRPITLEEISQTVKSMAKGKSSGVDSVARAIRRLVARFIWKPRAQNSESFISKVAFDTLSFPREKGGLGLVDPTRRNQAQLLIWVKKAAELGEAEHWVALAECVLMAEWELSRPKEVWACFFMPSFRKKKLKSGFWEPIRKAWKKMPPDSRSPPSTKEEVLRQLLFENPAVVDSTGTPIPADGKAGTFEQAWVRRGIVRVEDLWSLTLGGWIPLSDLKLKLRGLQRTAEHWDQITDAIPQEWIQILGPEGTDPPGTWYISDTEPGGDVLWKVLETLPSGLRRVERWRNDGPLNLLSFVEETTTTVWDNPSQVRVVEVHTKGSRSKHLAWVGKSPLRSLRVDPVAWSWSANTAGSNEISLQEYTVAHGYQIACKPLKPPAKVAVAWWQAVWQGDLAGTDQDFENLWKNLTRLPNGKQKYLAVCNLLHRARGLRHHAEEHSAANRIGPALATLKCILAEVQQFKPPGEDPQWKIIFMSEWDALAAATNRLHRENEVVCLFRTSWCPITESSLLYFDDPTLHFSSSTAPSKSSLLYRDARTMAFSHRPRVHFCKRALPYESRYCIRDELSHNREFTFVFSFLYLDDATPHLSSSTAAARHRDARTTAVPYRSIDIRVSSVRADIPYIRVGVS